MFFSSAISQLPHGRRKKNILGCFRRDKSRAEPTTPSKLPQNRTASSHPPNNKVPAPLEVKYPRVSLPQLDPASSNFIYNTVLPGKGGSKIRRLMAVDFRTDANIMSEDVYNSLHTKTLHLHRDPSIIVYIASMGKVTPLGSVDVKWSLWADDTVYNTRFYVVKGCQFDMLLGRPSVIEHQLSQKDPAVASRIQASYRDQ
ncbi:hypothetical protein FE257_007909 [Aspergillus nanangensis]|uniref:Uncharacterized protein n=1 Tax=Aspergillus nanangensis TaxID=2582783 RepID=A0AAD4CX89_ASPNN|nr:hypothetical protein FE257_007909 [Aspergillus nanangensis]